MSLVSSFIAPATCLVSGGRMLMSGLPSGWVAIAGGGVLGLSLWGMLAPVPNRVVGEGLDVGSLPVVGRWVILLTRNPWVLVGLRLVMVVFFLLIVAAGLFGTPMPRQNAATLLTWNLWWTAVIFSVFFVGSAWCAICPWDAIATWLVYRRLWRRPAPGSSLELSLPKEFRGVWVATAAFVVLSWLELGYGLTAAPYATALLALLMVLMATLSLALFPRKTFCRSFCPVGRTIGAYSQLAPVALRPRRREICEDCTTVECYHGTDEVPPCPTRLVMGRLRQNTYCTSCGNCTQSCPDRNVSWRLRLPSREAMLDARPHWDEAWFMLVLLTITLFHGFTMLSPWENVVRRIAIWLRDSGQLITSFTLAMIVACSIPVLMYMLAVAVSHWLSGRQRPYRELFSGLAFITLPLAFGYHLAHNMMHLNSETHGLSTVLSNPLGLDARPLSSATILEWMNHPLFAPWVLHLSQTFLILFGFWLAMLVLRHRMRKLLPDLKAHGWPLLLFALLVTAGELWMLSRPMVMRFQ